MPGRRVQKQTENFPFGQTIAMQIGSLSRKRIKDESRFLFRNFFPSIFFFFFMTTERRRAIFSFPFPFKSMTVRIIKFFFFYDVFFFFSSFFFFLNQKPPGQIRNKNLIYLAKNSLTNNLNRFIIERIAVPGSR